jgi:hypothetical protein
MLSNHDQFIPATISSKGSPTWMIMSLAFIRLILKPLIHLISVQILHLSQHPFPTLVLLPSLMSHLLHIIDNMVDLSIQLGLLPFFVQGRSTICTTARSTLAVM